MPLYARFLFFYLFYLLLFIIIFILYFIYFNFLYEDDEREKRFSGHRNQCGKRVQQLEIYTYLGY